MTQKVALVQLVQPGEHGVQVLLVELKKYALGQAAAVEKL